MNNRVRAVFLMLFVTVVLGAVAVQAQEDPPGVAGRLSFMSGPVSLQPGGVNDWVDATLNRPLTTSDRVWADQGARAEVSMGNVIARIDQETSMTITNLDDSITQLELDQGSLFIHVRRMFDGESVEIDTPNVAFVLDREGDYRFDVDPNNDTTYVSVRRGDGEGTGEAAGVHVRSGEQVVFSGGNSGQNQTAELGDLDDFDNWNMQRDDRADRSASARYVSPGMVGYEDLDDYGAWQEDQQYGPVWRPRVDVGWAPYHVGHWAWIDPWGYTWVDDAPWGYAPFHYGRWVYAGGGWGWAPGPPAVYRPGIAYVRPVYSPALVAFVGGGFGVGVAVGGGPVGWVPLGWGEPYYPSYHVSETYVRNVNVTNTRIVNITNVTNNYTVINRNNTTVINNVHYANQGVPGGVTAVPANAMASGRPVAQAAVRVNPQQMQQARFMAAPGVAPQKEAVLGGRAPATQHIPPRTVVGRPVMTKHAPPPPPVQFAAKQQLLEKNNGRPLEAAQVRSLPKVERPAPMKAGQPRPAAAVQQLNADKPKGGPAPAFHPAPAKGGPAGPANAARPNSPQPAARPNTPATPPNSPANEGRPANNNVPRPPNASTPANQPARNVTPPQPNTPRPAEPATRTNEPAAANPPARNVPRPPTRDNTPNTPANAGNPPARTTQPTYDNRSGQPANENRSTQPTYENRNAQPANPPRPAPETRTTEPANEPRNAAPVNQPRATQPTTNQPRPETRENNVPRPPEHQAAPSRSNPPAKENKESKPAKEDKKDEKPHR